MAKGMVTVEFYGIPRQRAGRAELVVQANTLGQMLIAVERDCPGLRIQEAGRISPQYRVSLNGQQFVSDLSKVLAPGCRVLILSADAGG